MSSILQTDGNPNFKDYGRICLRREDVLHIPGLGFDGLVGYSPIAMAKNAVSSFFLKRNQKGKKKKSWKWKQ